MRISDWSSDVCSSDLGTGRGGAGGHLRRVHPDPHRLPADRLRDLPDHQGLQPHEQARGSRTGGACGGSTAAARDPRFAEEVTARSEEHTSELQSLMRISYAVFCLKKKTTKKEP